MAANDDLRLVDRIPPGGGPARIQPTGVSMHPFIRRDDSVTITPRSPFEPRKFTAGDCILFRDEAGRWLIHRIIRDDTQGKLITKGDALLRTDRPVPREMIRGEVNIIERAFSGRRYRLDRPFARKANRLIAFLSRMEAAIPTLPRKNVQSSAAVVLIGRIIKSPKWLLTRICFP